MNFTEIKELLDQGFTPAQVMELNTNSENKVSENSKTASDPKEKTAEPVKTNDQITPEMINSLNAVMKELTHTIQANALLADQQPAKKETAVDDILAAIINPPERTK